MTIIDNNGLRINNHVTTPEAFFDNFQQRMREGLGVIDTLFPQARQQNPLTSALRTEGGLIYAGMTSVVDLTTTVASQTTASIAQGASTILNAEPPRATAGLFSALVGALRRPL